MEKKKVVGRKREERASQDFRGALAKNVELLPDGNTGNQHGEGAR